MRKNMIVAIDGVAGSGKGITAKLVAEKLGFKYVDTGAMYRALAYYLIQNNIPLQKDKILAELPNIKIDLQEGQLVFLDGKDITDKIRTPKVSGVITHFTNIKEVRQRMVKQQKKLGLDGGLVMEGRDIGSVVFPDAEVKIFLTADVEMRAKRRLEQLNPSPKQGGENNGKNKTDFDYYKSLQEIIDNLQKRDDADRKQLKVLFEKYNKEVEVIDTTNLSIEEQVNKVISLCL